MGNCKIVTYDLCAPLRDYKSLIDAIKSYSSSCKLTESCWLISSTQKCSEVRDNLKKHLDKDDRLFVAALTGEAAWLTTILSSTEKVKELLHS